MANIGITPVVLLGWVLMFAAGLPLAPPPAAAQPSSTLSRSEASLT